MTTVRHIEKAWLARTYDKLFRELVAFRPEASSRLEFESGQALPAAAMAVIRLEELSQTHTPLYARLIRAILAGQDPDGGWGELATTALCLRALLGGRGDGEAARRGLDWLANLQKPEGVWPHVPIRRMPADAYASAFVLYQLGDLPQFRSSVRFAQAVGWFETHHASLDEETRRLWDRARLRCRLRLAARPAEMALWS